MGGTYFFQTDKSGKGSLNSKENYFRAAEVHTAGDPKNYKPLVEGEEHLGPTGCPICGAMECTKWPAEHTSEHASQLPV